MSASTTSALDGLRGEQVVSPTAEEASRRLAHALVDHLKQRLVWTPQVHLALSGGSSASLLCSELAGNSDLGNLDWARIHIWMVDERCVPDDDPRLNFALIRAALVAKVPLLAAHVHPMPVLQADGAASYERELRAALDARVRPNDRRLDAIVLGMGPDGHTASLFPGTPALDEHKRLVVLNDGERVIEPRPRMTMTFPLLNNAHFIALLVTGESKQEALRAVAANPGDFHAHPVAGVIPATGTRMIWYLDQAAYRLRSFDEIPPPRSGSSS
jgi:6-phosphogluconolactonase